MADRPVILLEDDAETVEALSTFLELEGYQVLSAASLDEAEDLTRRAIPGLLILDLRIHRRRVQPNDVLKLRRISYGAPVITMSAAGKGDLEPSLYPSEGHLWKPFTLDELFALVSRLYRTGGGRTTPTANALGGMPIVIERVGGVLWLSGEINEKANLDAIETFAQGDTDVVRMDCAAIKRLNSFGVRVWLELVERLRRRGLRVVLRALSPPMVTQTKLIRNFLGGARVESFVALFECTTCDGETFEIVDTREKAFPDVTCPHCGAQAAVSDDISLYTPLFDAAP